MTSCAPPDYDWEADPDNPTLDVSCVSLGCWCAVAACLSHLKLRDAAYPFDWNRTTMQGVIHFLQTGFADFLRFWLVKPFPGSIASGEKAFCGAHHSVWHEDLSTLEGVTKYHRRISRFFGNRAQRLLFIRIVNTTTEVLDGKLLLTVLQGLFPKSDVFLLLIVDCQPLACAMVVAGTGGRLLAHCVAQWPQDVLVYQEAILFAYRRYPGPGLPVAVPHPLSLTWARHKFDVGCAGLSNGDATCSEAWVHPDTFQAPHLHIAAGNVRHT